MDLSEAGPGLGCTQVQTALGAVLRDARARGLPCGVFGSFGWSGEAVDELDRRLKVRCSALVLLRNGQIMPLRHKSMQQGPHAGQGCYALL